MNISLLYKKLNVILELKSHKVYLIYRVYYNINKSFVFQNFRIDKYNCLSIFIASISFIIAFYKNIIGVLIEKNYKIFF